MGPTHERCAGADGREAAATVEVGGREHEGRAGGRCDGIGTGGQDELLRLIQDSFTRMLAALVRDGTSHRRKQQCDGEEADNG